MKFDEKREFKLDDVLKGPLMVFGADRDEPLTPEELAGTHTYSLSELATVTPVSLGRLAEIAEDFAKRFPTCGTDEKWPHLTLDGKPGEPTTCIICRKRILPLPSGERAVDLSPPPWMMPRPPKPPESDPFFVPRAHFFYSPPRRFPPMLYMDGVDTRPSPRPPRSQETESEGDSIMNDKPGIAAQAQQAANIAKQASDVVSSIPGVPNKGVILHVLAGVGVAAGIVTAIATLGVVPGIVASLGGITMYVIGWLNPTPTAVAQFGQSAK